MELRKGSNLFRRVIPWIALFTSIGVADAAPAKKKGAKSSLSKTKSKASSKSKASNSKAADSTASESRTTDSSASDAKATDTKATDTKGADSKATDSKAKGDFKAQARTLVERAKRAFSKAAYAEAARLYLEAHEILESAGVAPKPDLLYNAGLAFERLDDCEKVAELFSRYLDLKADAASPDLVFRLKKARECAPDVSVETEPPGADVVVDGKRRGLTPIKINLKAGSHTLRLELPKYDPVEQSFAVEPRKPRAFSVKLESADKKGRIAIDLAAGAILFADDVKLAEGPFRGARELDTGAHRIRIEREGCVPKLLEVDVVKSKDPIRVDTRLDCSQGIARQTPTGAPAVTAETTPPPSRSNAPLWTTGVVGVAALATGVVLEVLSQNAVNRRDAEIKKGYDMASDRVVRDEQSTASGLAIGADISFGVAAASAITAGILYLVNRSDSSSPGPVARTATDAPRGRE